MFSHYLGKFNNSNLLQILKKMETRKFDFWTHLVLSSATTLPWEITEHKKWQISQQACDYIFYNNFNNKCPITIIFGIDISKSMRIVIERCGFISHLTYLVIFLL